MATRAPPRTATRHGPAGGRRILGRLLVERGLLDEGALAAALAAQAGSGLRLGELLVRRGDVEGEALARALASQLSLPFAAAPLDPEPGASALVREELARRLGVVPLAADGRRLRVATADPLDLAGADDVRFQTGLRVEVAVASPDAVRAGLDRAYGGEIDALLEALAVAEDGGEDRAVLEEAARSAPVVRLVDHVLHRAVEERASDVHIERHGSDVRVRYRVDGVLRGALALPRGARQAVLSRIKVMAGMDISVKRRPQDGALRLDHRGRPLAMRVSTLPVEGGEKAVVRVLDPDAAPAGLDDLGLSPRDLERLRALLRTGHGVILTAGPTGSGKSSTLQACLRELDRDRNNVVAIEDPVEARVEGVSHVQVAPRAGLTFPAALRSVLRQDPDVIMVGEIRDRETAEIAMAAAVTGHLVLSTIHTVDAPGAVARLLDMGVPPFLVAGGLSGVVAQRLVRTVCPGCRGRSGRGCDRCDDGYRGRTGVFQVMVVTDAMREEVAGQAGVGAVRRLAVEGGMGSLADDARRKVAEGATTPHEVGRVLVAAPAGARPCPSCAVPAPEDADGCPACGTLLVTRCRCGTRLRDGWRFCPRCLRRR